MVMDFLLLYFTTSQRIGTLVYIFFLFQSKVYFLANWVAEEVLIDFQEIIGKHSGENLAHAVWETLELYGLKGHVSVLHSILHYHAEPYPGYCIQQ